MALSSALQTLRDYRAFANPLIVAAGRLGCFTPRYCSCDVTANGQHYRVLARPNAGDPSILREVLVRQAYASVPLNLSNRPVRVLDVGAHIGMFTLWLSRQVQIESVTCFEPDPESFKLAQFNLAQVPQATVLNAAVGSRAREAVIRIDPHGSARSTLIADLPGREPNTQVARVRVVAIHDWLREHGPVDLLKLDCEGSEWELVRDCPEIFLQARTIVAELHDDPVSHHTHEDFRSLLRDKGFSLVPHPNLVLARQG